MQNVLITGANRGLGLAFTRQGIQRNYHVFATCRHLDKANDLQTLATNHPDRATVLRLDVTDQETIDASVEAVRSHVNSLDLLINNAGVNPRGERPGNLNAETMLHTLHVNAVGPMLVAQAYLDLLRAGSQPKIVNISSQMGSVSQKRSGGSYSYCSSKAALNMLSRALAFDLRAVGIIVVAVHPGWVQTDMGGSDAPLTPSESVRGLYDVIDGLRQTDSGEFYTWQGRKHPW